MDQPDGVRKLLLEKNNFITAMKSEDKKAAIEHLEKMKLTHKITIYSLSPLIVVTSKLSLLNL